MRIRYLGLAGLLLSWALLLAACGGGQQASEDTGITEQTSGSGGATAENTTSSYYVAVVGPNEDGAMPAGGKVKDPSHPPPKNPPDGVTTFPATTNRNVSGSMTYDSDPPTHGDHAPTWQNCGFYNSPVENEYAVHSLDHGVVWITYQPGLSVDQLDILRRLAREEYVLVSPYANLSVPVVATAWRNQLALTGADDPRLQQFVEQFRLSETAPRSGNGCTGGVGEPEA